MPVRAKKQQVVEHGVSAAAIADEVRDVKNWVAVFSEDHELPEEFVERLHEDLGSIVDHLHKL